MDKKLKIIALTSWYPNDQDPQLGIFIKHQLEAIANQHTLDLFTLRPSSNRGKQIVNENGINHHKHLYVANQYPIKQLSWYVAWMEIINKIPKNKYDLIHLHVVFPMGIVALKLKSHLNIPLITSEHWSGYTFTRNKSSWLRKRITKKIIETSIKVIVQSEFLKSRMLAQKLQAHYEIIPNIVTLNINNDLIKSKDNSQIHVLNVSDHIDSTKNLSGLLKAFQKAKQKNTKLHLHQIGDGPDNKSIKKLATILNLSDSITWYGRLTQDQVINHIQNCDFGIIPSNTETFSIVTFEMLCSQKPIVITECGGPEEFLPENFGVKVPVGDLEKMAEGIVQLSHTYLNYSLKESSLELAANFSKKYFSLRINRVYQEVINA